MWGKRDVETEHGRNIQPDNRRGRKPATPVLNHRATSQLHVFYRDWAREMLEIVRESFAAGLTLFVSERTPGRLDIFVATRERVVVHGFRDGETTILRAAAWDAQLLDVDVAAFRGFEDERARQGRYLVLMQTSEWSS